MLDIDREKFTKKVLECVKEEKPSYDTRIMIRDFIRRAPKGMEQNVNEFINNEPLSEIYVGDLCVINSFKRVYSKYFPNKIIDWDKKYDVPINVLVALLHMEQCYRWGKNHYWYDYYTSVKEFVPRHSQCWSDFCIADCPTTKDRIRHRIEDVMCFTKFGERIVYSYVPKWKQPTRWERHSIHDCIFWLIYDCNCIKQYSINLFKKITNQQK